MPLFQKPLQEFKEIKTYLHIKNTLQITMSPTNHKDSRFIYGNVGKKHHLQNLK